MTESQRVNIFSSQHAKRHGIVGDDDAALLVGFCVLFLAKTLNIHKMSCRRKKIHTERGKRALSACHFPLLAFGFSVCGSLLCVALLSACVTVKCVFPERSCRLFFSCDVYSVVSLENALMQPTASRVLRLSLSETENA